MNTYVIGDIHGCFNQFMHLLKKIDYKKNKDKIILVGDLVNRGPDSLSVLNYCMADTTITSVLGNHDLYLLYLMSIKKAKGSLKDIIEAKNNKKIFQWLLARPLMIEIFDELTENSFLITHAGIPEIWSPKKQQNLLMKLHHYFKKIRLRFLNPCGAMILNIGMMTYMARKDVELLLII